MSPEVRLAVRESIMRKATAPALARHDADHLAAMRAVRSLGGPAPRNAAGAQRRDCPRWVDCFALAARHNWRALSCDACEVRGEPMTLDLQPEDLELIRAAVEREVERRKRELRKNAEFGGGDRIRSDVQFARRVLDKLDSAVRP